MKSFKPRRFRTTLGAAALLAGFAAPATAHAGQSYVVTLNPAAETTCERTILDVSVQYGITLKSTYTSSLCGFSAMLSRRTVEELKLDPRVGSVQSDSVVTSG
jgi:hypothetical protein